MKAVVLAVIVISGLTFLLSPKHAVLRDSLLAPYVQEFARLAVQAAPADVQTLYEQKQSELKRYWSEHGGNTPKPGAPPPAKKESTPDNAKRQQ